MLIQASINCYLKRPVIKFERIFGEKRQENKRKEGDKIMNFTEQKLTGKASIDKPWLNFYP
mgnify:FL=1